MRWRQGATAARRHATRAGEQRAGVTSRDSDRGSTEHSRCYQQEIQSNLQNCVHENLAKKHVAQYRVPLRLWQQKSDELRARSVDDERECRP
jgi:hypothetical protein